MVNLPRTVTLCLTFLSRSCLCKHICSRYGNHIGIHRFPLTYCTSFWSINLACFFFKFSKKLKFSLKFTIFLKILWNLWKFSFQNLSFYSTLQLFFEHILCTINCSKFWGWKSETNRQAFYPFGWSLNSSVSKAK